MYCEPDNRLRSNRVREGDERSVPEVVSHPRFIDERLLSIFSSFPFFVSRKQEVQGTK